MNERQARRTITKCLLKGIKEGDVKPVKGYSSWKVYQIGDYFLVISPYFTSASPSNISYKEAVDRHTKNTDKSVQWWNSAFPFTAEGRQNRKLREAVKTPQTYDWVIPCD